MKQALKNIIKNYLLKKGIYLYSIPKSYDKTLLEDAYLREVAHTIITTQLYTTGSLKAYSQKLAVDAEGAPLPWMTYPFISYMQTLDLTDKVIFEYGAGNGTLFWAKHCKRIFSVENHEEWFNQMTTRKPQNSTIYLETEADLYVKSIEKPGCLFDIIIVDGACCRGNCIIASLAHLKTGGMIILDNANRFFNIHRYLFSKGFMRISFEGFTPAALHGNATAIFMHMPNYQFKQTIAIKTTRPDHTSPNDISPEQMIDFGLEPYYPIEES